MAPSVTQPIALTRVVVLVLCSFSITAMAWSVPSSLNVAYVTSSKQARRALNAVPSICAKSAARHSSDHTIEMTMSPSSPTLQSASQSAEVVAAGIYGTALANAWRGDDKGLNSILSADVQLDTPIWQVQGRDDYRQTLKEATEFLGRAQEAPPPTLLVLSAEKVGEGVAKVQWRLFVEWPSLWRSRVHIFGESELELKKAADGSGMLVTSVREQWHQSPNEVFLQQIMPRVRDIFSLWNTPTAEHFPIKMEEKRKGYDLALMPPTLAVQADWVETGDLLLREQMPLPPFFAFTGEVKRTEWYSSVSPVILRRSLERVPAADGKTQVGQRRRWLLPVPTAFGDDETSLPSPDGGADEEPAAGISQQSVKYVRQQAQRVAMRAIQGTPSNKAVLSAAVELAECAERDGLKVVKQEGRPVLLHLCYDAKVGFNSRQKVSMAVWLSVPKRLQENKVCVLIQDDDRHHDS